MTEGWGGELSPVPKLLASVAFNIPTTQSINIDTSREQERQRSTHRERERKQRRLERERRVGRVGESVRTAYTLSHIPAYMVGDTCCN